jgi:hypothetical protein
MPRLLRILRFFAPPRKPFRTVSLRQPFKDGRPAFFLAKKICPLRTVTFGTVVDSLSRDTLFAQQNCIK